MDSWPTPWENSQAYYLRPLCCLALILRRYNGQLANTVGELSSQLSQAFVLPCTDPEKVQWTVGRQRGRTLKPPKKKSNDPDDPFQAHLVINNKSNNKINSINMSNLTNTIIIVATGAKLTFPPHVSSLRPLSPSSPAPDAAAPRPPGGLAPADVSGSSYLTCAWFCQSPPE